VSPEPKTQGFLVLIEIREERIMATVTECWDVLQSRYAGFRRLVAKRLLENELSSIIRTVAGHKRNKLPKGASQYQSLWHVADTKVQRFCDDHRVDRTEVEAQIPALKELRDLSQAPATPNHAAQVAIGFISGTVVFIAIGFFTGVIHWLFTLGYSWAQHLPHF
jgi:hypothetical protein